MRVDFDASDLLFFLSVLTKLSKSLGGILAQVLETTSKYFMSENCLGVLFYLGD